MSYPYLTVIKYAIQAVAAKGAGGGHGPINSRTGIRPSYLASDLLGAQMPTYKNEQTMEMKRNLEPGSARRGKKRLGFTWQILSASQTSKNIYIALMLHKKLSLL